MTANPHDENAFLLLRMEQLNPRKLLSVSLLKGFRLALTFHFEIQTRWKLFVPFSLA
jgi:hypothetical protein